MKKRYFIDHRREMIDFIPAVRQYIKACEEIVNSAGADKSGGYVEKKACALEDIFQQVKFTTDDLDDDSEQTK